MATTVLDLMEAAFAMRTANDPEDMAGDGELIAVVHRELKSIYQNTAPINPFYFGKTADLVKTATSWTWPADAIVVAHLERKSDKATVHRVKKGEASRHDAPRVFRMGKAYYSIGGTDDPTPGTTDLTAYYAHTHPSLDPTAEPDAAANTLDSSWPEDFNQLLIAPLAQYLAIKDGRSGAELEVLVGEKQLWWGLFKQQLELVDLGLEALFSDGRLPGLVPGTR